MADTRPNQTTQDELAQYLSRLTPDRQKELLDFARFLTLQVTMKSPLHGAWQSLAGVLPDEDAREMSDIIADACERIDAEGW